MTLVGHERRRADVRCDVQRAGADPEAVARRAALGPADEAVRERMPHSAAGVDRGGRDGILEARSQRWLARRRLAPATLGDQRAVGVQQAHPAVAVGDDRELRAQGRRPAQGHLGRPGDERGDPPAGVAAVRAGGRAVEPRLDLDRAEALTHRREGRRHQAATEAPPAVTSGSRASGRRRWSWCSSRFSSVVGVASDCPTRPRRCVSFARCSSASSCPPSCRSGPGVTHRT